MTTKTEARLGLTNVFKRLAYAYLMRGFGKHEIEHDVFDEVEVRPLYDWQPMPGSDAGAGEYEHYQAAAQVIFRREGQKVRWVEFTIQFSGGGGDPTIFRVK